MAEWHKDLPEGLREEPSLLKYETPEEAYQGLIKANAALATSIRIPGPDAGEEDRAAFIEKLVKNTDGRLIRRPEPGDDASMAEFKKTMGIPEDVDEYQNPDGFAGLPDEVLVHMRKAAKNGALSKSQYQDMITYFSEQHTQEQEDRAAKVSKANAELKAEWGLAYDERIDMTNRLAAQFMPEGVEVDITPDMRRMLNAIGTAMSGEGPQAHFQPRAPEPRLDPNEAKKQMAEVRNRMLNGAVQGTGEYQRLQRKMAELTAIAYPEP